MGLRQFVPVRRTKSGAKLAPAVIFLTKLAKS
jgi:hypothetical protein